MTTMVAIQQETPRSKSQKTLVVVKIGTSSLLTEVPGQTPCVRLSSMGRIIEVVAELRRNGCNVVLVSSGAVGFGCIRLGLRQRPTDLGEKQAVAAVGQSYLVRMWEDLFSTHGIKVGQLLLARTDFHHRGRFQNMKRTM